MLIQGLPADFLPGHGGAQLGDNPHVYSIERQHMSATFAAADVDLRNAGGVVVFKRVRVGAANHRRAGRRTIVEVEQVVARSSAARLIS